MSVTVCDRALLQMSVTGRCYRCLWQGVATDVCHRALLQMSVTGRCLGMWQCRYTDHWRRWRQRLLKHCWDCNDGHWNCEECQCFNTLQYQCDHRSSKCRCQCHQRFSEHWYNVIPVPVTVSAVPTVSVFSVLTPTMHIPTVAKVGFTCVIREGGPVALMFDTFVTVSMVISVTSVGGGAGGSKFLPLNTSTLSFRSFFTKMKKNIRN